MNTNKILIISLLIFFQHLGLAESDANVAAEEHKSRTIRGGRGTKENPARD